jgi:glyoxylase-like metal-dependent hydrolase (beta-lactamase superfamily II)
MDIRSDWFEVDQLADFLYAISEPRHYEHTVIYLIVGRDRAILIDTGCGIGDLFFVVRQLTNLPVTVVNTHTHLDHLGSNNQFNDIVILDHKRSRTISMHGATKDALMWELHNEKLVTPPWPKAYNRTKIALPPFKVSRWLQHGDHLDIDGADLEVLHTPGEAPDHICLLDHTHRILFCGDILLAGAVWSHLDGGDVGDLLQSYQLLYDRLDDFDILMPSHNAPSLDKEVLKLALAGAKDVLEGKSVPTVGNDPWGRSYRRYDFGPIAILRK